MDGFCTGYVVGVVEGMKWGVAVPALMAGQEGEDINGMISILLQFCSPDAATWSQSIDRVVAYLSENPNERHLPARGLVQNALIEAFPCG